MHYFKFFAATVGLTSAFALPSQAPIQTSAPHLKLWKNPKSTPGQDSANATSMITTWAGAPYETANGQTYRTLNLESPAHKFAALRLRPDFYNTNNYNPVLLVLIGKKDSEEVTDPSYLYYHLPDVTQPLVPSRFATASATNNAGVRSKRLTPEKFIGNDGDDITSEAFSNDDTTFQATITDPNTITLAICSQKPATQAEKEIKKGT